MTVGHQENGQAKKLYPSFDLVKIKFAQGRLKYISQGI
jgi:hypothetical protein